MGINESKPSKKRTRRGDSVKFKHPQFRASDPDCRHGRGRARPDTWRNVQDTQLLDPVCGAVPGVFLPNGRHDSHRTACPGPWIFGRSGGTGSCHSRCSQHSGTSGDGGRRVLRTADVMAALQQRGVDAMNGPAPTGGKKRARGA